jgi:hypothetical protein
MYSKPEYHFPIVMAQYQYRERYYGLAGASLLEDLFFDAISHFCRTHMPSIRLERPPRGEKGYDYSFEGQHISHKVSKAGPIEIAALWDATKTSIVTWNFSTSVCFATGGYNSAFLELADESGITYRATPLRRMTSRHGALAIALAHWPSTEKIKILEVWNRDFSQDDEPESLISWNDIWTGVTSALSQGVPANELEVIVLPLKKSSTISRGDKFSHVGSTFRPGIYLLDQGWLQNVPVRPNNRGLLVSRALVKELMLTSIQSGDHIPLSDWFSVFTGNNPPDLYLAQKQEYDMFFSGYAVQHHPSART